MPEKIKFEDVKYILASIAIVAVLACCVSFSRAATIIDTIIKSLYLEISLGVSNRKSYHPSNQRNDCESSELH